MKIIITPEDQALAIRNFISEKYGIYLNIDHSDLSEVATNVEPIKAETLKQDLEDDREWAETRANELGLSFRSDIKTATLITRIEEEEERIAANARNPDPLPMDEPDYEEPVYEKDEEKDTQTEEENTEEAEEEKAIFPTRKKPSIFDNK